MPDRASVPTPTRVADGRLATALDLLILALPAWIVSVVLVGGFDRVWIADHHVAEPLLVLLLAVPLRVVLGGPGLLAGPWSVAASRVGASAERWGLRSHRVVDVVLVLSITRIPELAVAFLANVILPANRLRNFYMPFDAEKFAEIFAAWDSGWYYAVVTCPPEIVPARAVEFGCHDQEVGCHASASVLNRSSQSCARPRWS